MKTTAKQRRAQRRKHLQPRRPSETLIHRVGRVAVVERISSRASETVADLAQIGMIK